MKPELQIKALAELDGKHKFEGFGNILGSCKHCNKFYSHQSHEDLSYLTSYDAIIPLIQKQNWNMQLEVVIQLRIMKQKSLIMIPTMDNLEGWCAVMLSATPAQLCEALLRATGKWIE